MPDVEFPIQVSVDAKAEFAIEHQHPQGELVPMHELEQGRTDLGPTLAMRYVYECRRCDPPSRVVFRLMIRVDTETSAPVMTLDGVEIPTRLIDSSGPTWPDPEDS